VKQLNKRGILPSGMVESEPFGVPAGQTVDHWYHGWEVERQYHFKRLNARVYYQNWSESELQHRLEHLNCQAKRSDEHAKWALQLYHDALRDCRLKEAVKNNLEMQIACLGRSAQGKV
jgi:hypothetical protein